MVSQKLVVVRTWMLQIHPACCWEEINLSYAPRLAAHCWSAWELKAEIYLLLLVITWDTVFYHKVLQKVESWNDWPSFIQMFFEHSHKHLNVLTNLCKLIQAAPGRAILKRYSHWWRDCIEVQSGDLSMQFWLFYLWNTAYLELVFNF